MPMNPLAALFTPHVNMNEPHDDWFREATLSRLDNTAEHALSAIAKDGTLAILFTDGVRVFVAREQHDPIVWFDVYDTQHTRSRFWMNESSVIDMLNTLRQAADKTDEAFARVMAGCQR